MKNRIVFFCLCLLLINGKAFAQDKFWEADLVVAQELMQEYPDSSKNILQNLLESSVADHNEILKARVLIELGVLVYYLGDYDKALEFFSQAELLINQVESPALFATLMSNKGALYKSIGYYDRALTLYKDALAIDESLNDETKIAVRLNNIAGIYAIWAKYDLAIEYYSRALEIDKKNGSKAEEAIRYGNIGVIYYRLENIELSIDYLKKALAIDMDLGNEFNVAIRLNNLGRTYARNQEVDLALTCYKKAVLINKKTNNLADLSVSYNNIGDAYLYEQEKDSARFYFDKSLSIARNIGSISKEQEVLKNIAKMYFQFEDFETSISFYIQSLMLANELKISVQQSEINKALSEIYQTMNDYEKSNYFLNEYLIVQDSISKNTSKEIIANLQIKYSVEKKEKEIELLQKNKEISDSKILIQRWIIIIILLIIISLISVAVIYYRNKTLRAREERMILEKELNSYMQKAYRQQMNPHFLFNTLNSIQSFILKNDKESSSLYLSKFALLMRTVLENSDKDLITIASEIEAVELYIELEKLRFEKSIDFEVLIDKSLTEFKLPPLILQPFIENSIWHGFVNKNTDGKIQLSIKASGEDLVCEIIDNGIGLEASEKIKKKEHKSFGTAITASRLQLIRSINKKEYSVRTENVRDESGNINGTKVIIDLPLIDV